MLPYCHLLLLGICCLLAKPTVPYEHLSAEPPPPQPSTYVHSIDELQYFIIEKEGLDLHLKWSWVQPTPTGHFSIERSVNGIQFKQIGQMPLSEEGKSYSFTDAQLPPNQTYYYRLRHAAGRQPHTFSPIIPVKTTIHQLELLDTSSDPYCQNSLCCSLLMPYASTVRITVENEQGEQVFQQLMHMGKGTNPIYISSDQIVPGIYTIKARSKYERTHKRLIIY